MVADFLRVSPSGGEPVNVQVSIPDGASGRAEPEFLLDGRHFVFSTIGQDNVRGIYLGSLTDSSATRLADADTGARFLPPDFLVFVQQDRLVARRLDLPHKLLVGETFQIAAGVFVSI